MTPTAQPRPQAPLISALAVLAAAAMIASFFLPVWWVSLTAPNYPPDAFPDGIRLHFGFTGVANGCTTPPKSSRVAQETLQEDLGWRDEKGTMGEAGAGEGRATGGQSVLDCVHEMNTINHYVGMHPIEFGAPVERLLSRYILGVFAVMLLGFAVGPRKARLVVLGAGFAAVTGWMLFDLAGTSLVDDFVTRYVEETGKYFREAEVQAAWGVRLRGWITGVAAFLVASMAFMVFGSARWPRFQLLLAAVPALLPIFFVGPFAGWLWYFGHSLHPWGAFTLKPFMPTVFGDGKVAQFTTHSYPHLGFALLVAVALALVVALARRRHELNAGLASNEAPLAGHPAPAAGKA